MAASVFCHYVASLTANTATSKNPVLCKWKCTLSSSLWFQPRACYKLLIEWKKYSYKKWDIKLNASGSPFLYIQEKDNAVCGLLGEKVFFKNSFCGHPMFQLECVRPLIRVIHFWRQSIRLGMKRRAARHRRNLSLRNLSFPSHHSNLAPPDC